MNSSSSKSKLPALLLSVCLALCLLGLIFFVLYRNTFRDPHYQIFSSLTGEPVVVSDLSREGSCKVDFENLMPGDTHTRYYSVSNVSKSELFSTFSMDVAVQSKEVSRVMYIRVTRCETETVLCEGYLSDLEDIAFCEPERPILQDTKGVTYRVDYQMDPHADNSYANATLKLSLSFEVPHTDTVAQNVAPFGLGAGAMGSFVGLLALGWKQKRGLMG